MLIQGIGEKECKKCGVSKPITTEFYNLLSNGSWRGTCKICMAKNTKRHYDKDPSKTIERVNKYKNLVNRAEGECTSEDKDWIRSIQGDRCFYCKEPLNGAGEFDHKIPVSRGGSNHAENIALACRTCNRDKRDKTSEEFFIWLKSRNNFKL